MTAPAATIKASIARGMSEKRLQANVVSLAKACGWSLVYHTHDSRRSEGGFPDLIMLRGDRGLAVELKAEHDSTKAERKVAQQVWLDGFERIAGFDAYLWRPSHWLSGDVEKVLTR